MAEHVFYLPDSTLINAPVVIGLPGLLHHSERGRCDDLLAELASRMGIAGVRLSYSGVSLNRPKGEISCSFDIDTFVEDLRETFDIVSGDNRFRGNRIGILASSMSAAVVGHYLGKFPDCHNISAYVSISPLPGWEQFATANIREDVIRNKRDVPLTSAYDRQNGVKRFIPKEFLERVQMADSLSALGSAHPRNLRAMTLFGIRDKVSDPRSIGRYHELLGGKAEDLVGFDSEHDLNLDLCKDKIFSFFGRNLVRG